VKWVLVLWVFAATGCGARAIRLVPVESDVPSDSDATAAADVPEPHDAQDPAEVTADAPSTCGASGQPCCRVPGELRCRAGLICGALGASGPICR